MMRELLSTLAHTHNSIEIDQYLRTLVGNKIECQGIIIKVLDNDVDSASLSVLLPSGRAEERSVFPAQHQNERRKPSENKAIT